MTLKEILDSINFNNLKQIAAGKVNDKIIDLTLPLEVEGEVEVIEISSKEGLKILRHSASHVMAQVLQELFPDTKLAIGPATDNGFYYDLDSPHTFIPSDFPEIEKRMEEIIKNGYSFIREEIKREDAISLFNKRGEHYKILLLEDIGDDHISLYHHNDFVDLCRGPHLFSTSQIKAFKLTGVAGAYWRGDENNKMLQRIYGTAFPDKKALKHYLYRLEEAKKRDHRRLGKELDLFSLHEEAGGGLVIYHPKGTLLRTIIEDFEKKEHLKRGYEIVKGPQILKLDLWEKSGHLANYLENMYFTEVDEIRYGLKPMNCLSHILIYKSRIRSYRDLPIRYFELGTVHRHEKSGVLHGLTRVREFTQDDAHIFCRPDQLESEISGVIDFVLEVMQFFDFDFELELSTRPEKSIGSDEDWERATNALIKSLKIKNLPLNINEGEGAFYGPKIDVKLKDILERSWQCATIQCDFTLPLRFDLAYIGQDGGKHRPVMLHRVILGSLERFIGVLIEHYNGAFPVWLSPIQAIIMNINENHIEYSLKVYKQMQNEGIRVEKDLRNESLKLKIREAQLQKVPYMLIIGDKEVKEGSVTSRKRSGENLPIMLIEEFIELIKKEQEINLSSKKDCY
ncbi:MAG: threonine--tRNA ligase [Thermodesulfobacteriota bacterium]|nr:threonine--tRNA ligase [Thermodesulfobacteriota bacterium]